MSDLANQTANISTLARLTGIDRSVVSRRLENLQPVSVKAKEKTYKLGEALRELLASSNATMDEAKLRKAQADAELAEIELQKERGLLLPRADVQNTLTDLWQRLHRRVCVTAPPSWLPQFKKAEDDAHRVRIAQGELETVFHELRRDHPSFQ